MPLSDDRIEHILFCDAGTLWNVKSCKAGIYDPRQQLLGSFSLLSRCIMDLRIAADIMAVNAGAVRDVPLNAVS